MKRILLVLLLMGIAGYAYIYYEQRDRQLSEPPAHISNETAFEIEPSTIAVNVSIPFNQLSAQANKSAPNEYSDSGNGEDYCEHILRVRICAGTKYEYTVKRGQISISPGPNNTIHVSVPVSISGKGGFRGDGCKHLKCDAKNFRASVEAYSDIALQMGSDWCPKASVSSDFRWIQGAKVEIVHGIWVGISNLVEGKLRDQLQKMGNAVASEIKCSDVKREVEKAWVSYSFPIDLAANDDSLFINVIPEDFGFSGLQVSSDSANVALSLKAKIDVSSTAKETKKLDLPALKKIPLPASALIISVPLHMSYGEIIELLSGKVLHKPISMDTPAGVATVVARKLKIYPSGESIAIGALLDINLPDRWLDVSGWVYLKTKPTPIAGGKKIKLENPHFSRSLNNEIWSVLSAVLEGTIKQEIVRAGEISLEEPIKDAKELIAAGMNKPHSGVAIKIGDPKISLGRIAVNIDRLFVEGLFSSKADISLKAF